MNQCVPGGADVTLGERLVQLRKAHGIKHIAEAARRMPGKKGGYSGQWLSNFESNKRVPSLRAIRNVASFYGVAPAEAALWERLCETSAAPPVVLPDATPDNLHTPSPAPAPGAPEATADAGSDGSRQHDGSAALGKPSLTGDAGRGVGSLAESLDPMAAVMKLIDIADRSSRASERLADTVYALVQEKGAAAPRGRAGAGGGSPRAKPEGSPQKRAGGRR